MKKAIKYTSILLTLSLISLSAFTSENEQTSIHEIKMNKMIELGLISEKSAKKQLSQIHAHKKRQEEFKLQTRGVASTIKNFKIYEIKNEPIEIPSN